MEREERHGKANMDVKSIHSAALEVWQLYLKKGPGGLPPDSLSRFDQAKQQLSSSLIRSAGFVQVENVLAELEPLLRRCVERTEGLCFVTGEAGLIPNRSLHDKCEHLLEQLHQMQGDPSTNQNDQ